MYLAVGIGGVIGAILRFLIYKWFIHAGNIPIMGTLFVNLSGCFLLGCLQGLARTYHLPNWIVVGMGTGVIGAYTTFSTFSVEVITYFQEGIFLLPVMYILLSLVGGYFFVYSGFSLTRWKRKGV
jgi:fluoride exporter